MNKNWKYDMSLDPTEYSWIQILLTIIHINSCSLSAYQIHKETPWCNLKLGFQVYIMVFKIGLLNTIIYT